MGERSDRADRLPLPVDLDGATSLGVLGRGASGVVELVRFPDGRRFAVKRLAGVWDDAAAARFRREARIVGRLDHPNIVRSAGGIDQIGAWIVMDYVTGPTLSEVLAGGELATAEALRVLEGLCAAVAYAHTAQVVHRDISPANVLFDHDGTPQLCDFGVATMAGAERHLSVLTFRTRPGSLIGTPSFMSPEAAAGASDATPRWDVYSLGILAYRLLVGRLPFDATRGVLAVLDAHIHQSPPDPDVFGARLPAPVTAAVQAALAKSPAARTPSVGQFWQDLGAAADRSWPRWRQQGDLGVRVARLGSGAAPDDRRPGAGGDGTGEDEATEAGTRAADALGRSALARIIVDATVSPTVFRPRRSRRWPGFVLAGLVGAAAAVTVGVLAGSRPQPVPVIERVTVRAVRSPGASGSDRPAACGTTVRLTGRVVTDGTPGVVTYRWYAEGSALGPARQVDTTSGHRSVTVAVSLGPPASSAGSFGLRASSGSSSARGAIALGADCRAGGA